jgi:hypothetical protein
MFSIFLFVYNIYIGKYYRTRRHDITEILLKVALNTIKQKKTELSNLGV